MFSAPSFSLFDASAVVDVSVNGSGLSVVGSTVVGLFESVVCGFAVSIVRAGDGTGDDGVGGVVGVVGDVAVETIGNR